MGQVAEQDVLGDVIAHEHGAVLLTFQLVAKLLDHVGDDVGCKTMGADQLLPPPLLLLLIGQLERETCHSSSSREERTSNTGSLM